MALSPLKNKQIEAFHDKGLTVKEISRKTHCTYAEIRQFLKSKGKEPIEVVKKDLAASENESQDVELVSDTFPTSISQAVLQDVKSELSLTYDRINDQQQRAWKLGELYIKVKVALGEIDLQGGHEKNEKHRGS